MKSFTSCIRAYAVIAVIVLLQDLEENGVDIELMHLGSSFDVSLFYQVSGVT